MRYPRKSFLVLGVLGVLLVGAVVAFGPARLVAELRWRNFTPIARTFLETAARRDSIGLTRLAVDSNPVIRALELSQVSRDVAATAARSLRPAWGTRIADTVVVDFYTTAPICPSYVESPTIQLHFVAAGAGWRVSFLGGAC